MAVVVVPGLAPLIQIQAQVPEAEQAVAAVAGHNVVRATAVASGEPLQSQ